MEKKVFIIHGWNGNPNEAILSWLSNKLRINNFKVYSPEMPNPESPDIISWVSKLNEVVGNCDKDTYFVGHSIGCQTILRYIEQKNVKEIGGAVFIAPWFNLTKETFETGDDENIARPWINTRIDLKEVRTKLKKLTAVFSEDDPYVPITDSEKFEKDLGAKIIIEKDKGHFSEEDNVRDSRIVLKEILEIAK
jgi:predicted alpha/beta hydrolase family esterase